MPELDLSGICFFFEENIFSSSNNVLFLVSGKKQQTIKLIKKLHMPNSIKQIPSPKSPFIQRKMLLLVNIAAEKQTHTIEVLNDLTGDGRSSPTKDHVIGPTPVL